MRVTADTNVLVRAVVGDDRRQARAAARLLREAEQVAVPVTCLCEFAWVLLRVYRFTATDVGDAISALIDAPTVATNRPAVEAGLAQLRAGGDFADGVIAWEGRWLGAQVFASFDRETVRIQLEQGLTARQVT